MGPAAKEPPLTGALEDYVETIYELVREHKVARVRDIARARRVRAGSVSPAMKRLADLGLIRYVQREYIDLTPAGESAARQVFARHQVLSRLLEQILGMSPESAARDACAMEHSLSSTGMEHLVRLFEFLSNRPEGQRLFAVFHRWAAARDRPSTAPKRLKRRSQRRRPAGRPGRSVAELAPGERARIVEVGGAAEQRMRLLDMGLLPDVMVELDRVDLHGDRIWIKLQGFAVALDRRQAESVSVGPAAGVAA